MSSDRPIEPVTVKVVGWRVPEDLIERVHAIARRDGRYVERVAADALRAGLLAVETNE